MRNHSASGLRYRNKPLSHPLTLLGGCKKYVGVISHCVCGCATVLCAASIFGLVPGDDATSACGSASVRLQHLTPDGMRPWPRLQNTVSQSHTAGRAMRAHGGQQRAASRWRGVAWRCSMHACSRAQKRACMDRIQPPQLYLGASRLSHACSTKCMQY